MNAQKTRPNPQVNGHPQGRSRRILVVEDHDSSRLTMQLLLDIRGHMVETADTGRMALLKAFDFRPEVVLLDLGLPDMTGQAVSQAIREMTNPSPPCIIALTGRAEVLDGKFDHHLLKPADPDELEQLLQNQVASESN